MSVFAGLLNQARERSLSIWAAVGFSGIGKEDHTIQRWRHADFWGKLRVTEGERHGSRTTPCGLADRTSLHGTARPGGWTAGGSRQRAHGVPRRLRSRLRLGEPRGSGARRNGKPRDRRNAGRRHRGSLDVHAGATGSRLHSADLAPRARVPPPGAEITTEPAREHHRQPTAEGVAAKPCVADAGRRGARA